MENNKHFCITSAPADNEDYSRYHIVCKTEGDKSEKLVLEHYQCIDEIWCKYWADFQLSMHNIKVEMEVKFCPMCGFTPEV